MRAFLDTNVVLAAYLTDGVCRRLLSEAIAGRFEAVVSIQVVSEMERHLKRDFHVPAEDARRAVDHIGRVCRVVPVPENPPKVCRDPDDDGILAAAHTAGVVWLVTGDKDLLVLNPHAGVSILRPADFLRRLEGGQRRNS